MALVVHCLASDATKVFRVWDTGLKEYRTDAHDRTDMLGLLARLLRAGGIAESPDGFALASRMLLDAEDKPASAWHVTKERGPRPSDSREMRLRRLAHELARQSTTALFERELRERLDLLGEDARRLMTDRFVLQELAYGSGHAFIRPVNAETAALAEEIFRAWPWLSIEIENAHPDGPRIVFSLL